MDDLNFDARHIWHPYASLPASYPLFEVQKTQQTEIILQDGTVLIDGMSSWWSAIHGYNHPILLEAINNQIQQCPHIMFGGLTHQPAIKLTKKLLEIVPNGLDKVFFSDSGSVAVEVAIKMVLQYQSALGFSKKTKIVALKGGYHGDTFMAMSVSDPINSNHSLFKSVLPKHLFAPKPKCTFDEPWQDNFADEISEFIKQNHQNIAGFILEPIAQGAGGMWFYHPKYLNKIRKLCDEFDILLIADEIATGFGRTGRLFAVKYADISPDILCLGKALTGGMMSFATTITTEKVSKTIAENPPNALMHGPTFMANPTACAVSLASINLLFNTDWKMNVQRIEAIMQIYLTKCQLLKSVNSVRILGAIGVVELYQAPDMARIQPELVKAGVWVRPFGKLIYIMPAFIIKDNDLIKLCEVIFKVIQNY